MDDNLVIALFRHGITQENKRKAYLGWSDSPLSKEESLSIRPIKQSYDLYFSSDLERCIHTTKLLFPNENAICLSEFREMNFGKWEKKTYEQLKDRREYQRWLTDPFSQSPPDGELFSNFQCRVQSGWNKILNRMFDSNCSSAAVVTHGGVIRLLLSELSPVQKAFWEWTVSHGIGFELIFEKEALRRGERCTLLQEVPITAKEHG
ncbi:histidine phosphatase family protein [Alkalihalobacillus sp. TS-13]|uniref:histidine phosphatase family protein n=1 Tax=Alkalihalobacillus sp. TS-13 TaxID=2842455 RepID=UPI001C870B5B|nr:histidine phosphatase family protein [Alkalihalobacillus sp. TS-13]